MQGSKDVQDLKELHLFFSLCYMLVVICFLEVVSMNTFLSDAINIFCCKCLKSSLCAWMLFIFYAHLLPLTNKHFVIVITYDLFQRILPKFSPFSTFVYRTS